MPYLSLDPKQNKLFFDDCIDVLRRLPDSSVDMLLQDPPYGTTRMEWTIPNFSMMVPEWFRVTKETAAMVFFAAQPFTTDLINAMRPYFRYSLVWEKAGRATGHLNANRAPLRSHEDIVIFYKKRGIYNPQRFIGKPSHPVGREGRRKSDHYGQVRDPSKENLSEWKYPKSVLSFSPDRPVLHPNQKPLALVRWLVRTYTHAGDLVFDGYAGSGTTMAAALIEGRRCITAENDEQWYAVAQNRIKKLKL